MIKLLNNFRSKIHYKIIVMGAACVVFTVLALMLITIKQTQALNESISQDIKKLSDSDLDHVVTGIYNLIQSQDKALQQQVANNLLVAHFVLKQYGEIYNSEGEILWDSVNQFSGETQQIPLPLFFAGNTWLGQITDASLETPVVDEIRDLVGGSVTIFQRIVGSDDFLRVATNVIKADGSRAIGTYIPAIEPNGTPNSVVTSLLNGETYHGIAFVVDAWYMTAYEPIFDSMGEVIGALYVGVKLDELDYLRDAIMSIRVGETG